MPRAPLTPGTPAAYRVSVPPAVLAWAVRAWLEHVDEPFVDIMQAIEENAPVLAADTVTARWLQARGAEVLAGRHQASEVARRYWRSALGALEHPVVEVGDPDPTPAWHPGRSECLAGQTADGRVLEAHECALVEDAIRTRVGTEVVDGVWTCTWFPGHGGPHISGGDGIVCATWPRQAWEREVARPP